MALHGMLLSYLGWYSQLPMLDEVQKRVCRTVDTIFAASPEPLGHRKKVAS